MLEWCLNQGINLNIAPNSIEPGSTDTERETKMLQQYRQTSYLMQAAMWGQKEMFNNISGLVASDEWQKPGFFCLSRKRKNYVSGNALCAAAYYGQFDMAKRLIDMSGRLINKAAFIDHRCKEQVDTQVKAKGPYQPEFNKFIPLQLAIVSERANLELVKFLVAESNLTQVQVDSTGDNLIHLAAKYATKREILEYLARTIPELIFQRNQQGETPLSIAQQKDKSDFVKMLESFAAQYDKSSASTNDLLASLEAEEEKKAREAQKRKEKKYQQKLRKLAERDNLTVEETQKRLENEKLRKKEEEEKQERERAQKQEREERERL